MKPLRHITYTDQSHWVGDGFPVRTLFSYNAPPTDISPFLHLDYAGPADFLPATKPRGVGMHPHRGFETVTLLYQGEVEHRDTAGNGGLIKPGDVQWMTAANGLLHEEKHSAHFTQLGGKLEAIQLWVNLPTQYKMIAPSYQSILENQIPVVKLTENGSFVRVIAGDFKGTKGPARTFTPINLWDLRLLAGQTVELDFIAGYTTLLFNLKGRVKINQAATLNEAQLASFEKTGKKVVLTALQNSTLLVLNGQPINEPVCAYGPYVMNTRAEIEQAIRDFNYGEFSE